MSDPIEKYKSNQKPSLGCAIGRKAYRETYSFNLLNTTFMKPKYIAPLREQMSEEQFEYLRELQWERETTNALDKLYIKHRCPTHGNYFLHYRHKDKTPARKLEHYNSAYEIRTLLEIYCDMCNCPKQYPWHTRILARIRGRHQNRWLEKKSDDQITPNGFIQSLLKSVDDCLLNAAEKIKQRYLKYFYKRRTAI